MNALRIAALGLLVAAPAWPARPALAAAEPNGNALDMRMRSIAYQAGNIVVLHSVVGRAFTIVVSPSEHITDGWSSDSKHLLVDLADNIAVIKADMVLVPQPLFLRTELPDKQHRLYSFQIDAADLAASDNSQVYSVRFTYPGDEAVARVLNAKEQAKAAAAKRVADALNAPYLPGKLGCAAAADATTAGAWNFRYVGQGDPLLPSREVCDDGQSTYLTFPRNSSVPAVFVVTPDGKEAVAPWSFDSDTGVLTVHQTSRILRLRDGNAVMSLFNRRFDPVGSRTATGTVSPEVVRVAKEAKDPKGGRAPTALGAQP